MSKRILDQVITVYEAAELIGGFNDTTSKMVRRRCINGTYIARKDNKGTWLILKSSVVPSK